MQLRAQMTALNQALILRPQIEQVNATYDYQTQLSALNYQIGNLR